MKKVKCIDDSGGGLSIKKGEIYNASESGEHFIIDGCGWYKNRFVVVSLEEETLLQPPVEAIVLPSTEVPFDFDAYNGLRRAR